MTSGGLTFRLEMIPGVRGNLSLLPALVPALVLSSDEMDTIISSNGLSTTTTAAVSLVSIGLLLLPSLPSPQPQQPQQHPIDLSIPPLYCMRRDVRTVEHLYREWTIGLQGCLHILELDRRYCHYWRRGRCDELQFYSLLREIIKEIDRIAYSDRVSEMIAM
jgi:hypothetical protein